MESQEIVGLGDKGEYSPKSKDEAHTEQTVESQKKISLKLRI